MNNLITVEVVCPALSRSYDFMMPPALGFGVLKEHIIEDIRIYEDIPLLFENGDVMLFFAGKYLSDDKKPNDVGLKNGDRIYIL